MITSLCKHSTELSLKQIDKYIDIKLQWNWTNMFVFVFSVLNALSECWHAQFDLVIKAQWLLQPLYEIDIMLISYLSSLLVLYWKIQPISKGILNWWNPQENYIKHKGEMWKLIDMAIFIRMMFFFFLYIRFMFRPWWSWKLTQWIVMILEPM